MDSVETQGHRFWSLLRGQRAQPSHALTLLFGFTFAGEALGGRTDDSLLWSPRESILKGLFVLLASTCWKLCNHSRS